MVRRALEDDPSLSLLDLITLYVDSAAIERGDRALVNDNRSVRTAILPAALKDCGIDRADLGERTQLYLRDEGVLIVDLDDQL